jgi:hypothetical protein
MKSETISEISCLKDGKNIMLEKTSETMQQQQRIYFKA